MQEFHVNGVTLATIDLGAGLPLVLVHGFPLDHSMWEAQIDGLSEHCRVIAPDLRGFGSSSVTEGAVSMETFADDLAALLDAMGVGEPVVLCGLSMGGYIALAFWRKYASRLAGLVLCDTRARPDTPEAAQGRRDTAARLYAEGPEFLAESMIPRLLAPSTLQARPDIASSLRLLIAKGSPRGFAAAALGMAEREDFSPRLREIRCPALVLVGEHDAISTPAEMRSIADAIPRAKLVVIEGAGHMTPVERPAEVTAALAAFLAEIKESQTATGS